MSTILDPLSVETRDLAVQQRIIGLTIGMISAVAGQDTPFAEGLTKKKMLPVELIVAIHESAAKLATDPKYQSLDQEGAIKAGQKIGNEVRRKLAKCEFDNLKLMQKNETIDTEAIKNVILQGAEKPNYDRLLANKAETRTFIEEHLKQGEPATPKPQELYSEVGDLLAGLKSDTSQQRRKDYSAIIDKLEEARDNEFGIVWKRGDPQHTDGSRDLIRDARDVTGITESPISYALQAVSSIRAAEEIIKGIDDPEKQATAREQLKEQMDKVMDLLPKADDPGHKMSNEECGKFIKEFNFELVEILENAGAKAGEKEIGIAKEILSFDDPQYHVTTINSIPGRSELMIESETMLLGLTDAQKKQYEAIAESLISDTPLAQPVTCGSHDMGWYNELPNFDKALIREYAGEIAKGNYILPNQLSKHFIGLRNAYNKATFIHTPQDGLELLDEGLHSSTVSFHGKGDKQQVVNENIEQIRSFLPLGQDININTLNSPGNPSPDGVEREICRQISASQASVGGERSVTPLALWRVFPKNKNDNSGYEKALTEIASGLEKDPGQRFTNLANFLKTGQNEKEARKEINALRPLPNPPVANLRLANVLEHALEAKKLILDSGKRKLPRSLDKENGNLTLSVRMRMVSHDAQKGALAGFFEANKVTVNVPAILRHCKSGKDRTGLAEMETTRIAVLDRLGIAYHDVGRAQEIFQAQVNGGHTQFITSVNGGSTGTHGVKSDSKTAVPKQGVYKGIKGIILKTASFNKFQVKKPAKQKSLPDAYATTSVDSDNSPKSTSAQPVVSQAGATMPDSFAQSTQSQYPLEPMPQYQSQNQSQSGSRLTARDIMDSQTDSHKDFKKASNVAIGAGALFAIGLLMGAGVIGILLLVAGVAGAFAINANQKMQNEKRQIATQKNIEKSNQEYLLQKQQEYPGRPAPGLNPSSMPGFRESVRDKQRNAQSSRQM